MPSSAGYEKPSTFLLLLAVAGESFTFIVVP